LCPIDTFDHTSSLGRGGIYLTTFIWLYPNHFR